MEETDRELQVSSSLYPQHLYGGHAAMLSVNGSWRPEWDNILQFIQVWSAGSYRLAGLVVKASALRAAGPMVDATLSAETFSGSRRIRDLETWHSSGHPARCLAL